MDSIKDIERERRQRIVEQNGNSGLHYSSEEVQNGFKPTIKHIPVAEDRKNTPVYSGFIKYFPDAIKEIAKCSYKGQQQHNPDKPLAWDRSKSGDELDAMMRHLLDHASGIEFDEDGVRHIVKCGWRILAYIQKTVENKNE